MTKPEQYIHDVQRGVIPSCRWVSLAVKRHVDDLKRKKWEYHFDAEAGLDAIRKMETFEHYEGKFKGEKFILIGWQAFIVYVVFGWKTKRGYRRFQKVYIEVAKKNGKTAFAAIVALFLLIYDNEGGAEVYSFATNTDQAKICFDDCKKFMSHMMERSAVARDNARVMRNAIVWKALGSKMGPLSNDRRQGRKDGIRTHGGICDEYHAHEDNQVHDQVSSSMVNREQPLMWAISTAGFNKKGPCYELRAVCLDILAGKVENENQFAIIFTLDKDEDWNDPEVWHKSNPSLGIPGCAILEKLKQEYADAITKGESYEVNFKTKNLNIWTDAAQVWINEQTWEKNTHGINVRELTGRQCYGGLDLASGIDFNALVLLFPNVRPDIHAVKLWLWKPENKLFNNKEKIDYRNWAKAGLIETTPGDIIDWSFITEKIKQVAGIYDLQSIAYDPYRANHGVVQDLINYGILAHDLAQIMSRLAEPTRQLETLATSHQFEHFGNPVLAWMMGQTEIIRDSKGNIMVTKADQTKKVDGVSALVNAIGEWKTFENQVSEDWGFILKV